MHARHAAVWLGLLAVAAPLLAVGGEAGHGRTVLMVDIDGVVTQGTTLHVEAALREAERRDIPLLLRLNTPGGLVDATLDIDVALANADVPVLTFVGPRSAFAASAGTFILLMGQPSGMAPGTTIGSAQPITVDPAGGTQEAGDKVENFLVGRIEEIAERTGRDPVIAARFVTENLNLDADEARNTGMIDAVAADVAAFLLAVDGEGARVGSTTVILETAGAHVETFKRTPLAAFVDFLSNPQIAFVLVLAGTYAVVFGLANPGSYVPEVLGAVILLLGFIGLGLFSTSTAGVVLLVLAVLFFVVEVFTPTHGVLTGAGVVAMLLAVLFLIDEPLLPASFLRTFTWVGYTLALLSGAAVFLAVWFTIKTRDKPAFDVLRGAEGEVVEGIAPEGHVEVHGELWKARSADGKNIRKGARIVVTGREGLTLLVLTKAKAKEAGVAPVPAEQA